MRDLRGTSEFKRGAIGVTGATEKQVQLLKKYQKRLKKGMSVLKADKLVKKSLDYYKMLEHLLEIDRQERDLKLN